MITYTQEELDRARKGGDVIASASTHGVAFKAWLEGSAGAGFALLREPNHSNDDIARAKRWLVNNRDVVVLYVYHPSKPTT